MRKTLGAIAFAIIVWFCASLMAWLTFSLVNYFDNQWIGSGVAGLVGTCLGMALMLCDENKGR